MSRPGLLSPRVCVFIMVYLVGSPRCSETGAEPSCACTEIPELAGTQLTTPGCYQIGGTFRYKCNDGFVRKAGTSNLIRCVKNKEWSKPSLQCIKDPLDTQQSTTEKTSTTFSTSSTTPSLDIFSSVSSETELTSTLLPPQHTPGSTLETSALPQTSSNAPSTSPTTSSAPVTPEGVHSPSSATTPTTTHRSWRLDRTTPPIHSSLNSTSSTLQGTGAVATKVIAPVAVGVIVLAVIGVVWFLYRRKSRNSLHRNYSERPEESVPMQKKEDMT